MAETKTRLAEETVTAAEAYETEYYDLLPIEMKLIKYSLGLGVTLLVIFILMFRVF